MFLNKRQGEIDLDLIEANPEQPRKIFEERELVELADSINRYGVLQPIIVKRGENGKYFLIAGERRMRAAKMAGLVKIPAIIKDINEKDVALVALVENVQRENLSFIEEAIAYKKLMEDYNLSQNEISKQVGKQQSTISNKIRILSLPREIITAVLEHNLTERHARALLKIEDSELCQSIINRIIANGLNVKQTEKLIEDLLEKREEEQQKRSILKYINYKIYLNTIRKTFEQIKQEECAAKFYQEDLGENIEIKIVIPKQATKSAVNASN